MSNKRRVLAEVLSIDAWHEPMRFNGESFSVHVELSFRGGRVGGDNPDFPFTFNIALKRALLTLNLERPLIIERNSVARSIPKNKGELTRISRARDEVRSNAELGGKLSPSSMAISLSGGSKKSEAKEMEDKIKVVQEVPRIIALPLPSGLNEYAWELKPGQSETLEGQPWDPVEEPRLSAKIKTGGQPKIEPIIKAIVTCKLEDIAITELTLKDTSFLSSLKEAAFNNVNKAAAIQHLKFTLREMELETGEFGDLFSAVTIADLIVAEQDND
ncbi:hypothetical protein SAMN05428950_101409 [Sphingomonas sp. OV641]|uniref:hypothetical protein n=1 Tax=Sphingomonas sp. OV641 TaxID=1881068 RepID=UPI0008C56261|nr:hypothetical protein [Sphingomonas sp. OV641]SEI86231.1 hypothetical protein SAMN05428950_101409 [Sphingomonas sp. OV641]